MYSMRRYHSSSREAKDHNMVKIVLIMLLSLDVGPGQGLKIHSVLQTMVDVLILDDIDYML